MKRCSKCHIEYQDTATQCPIDKIALEEVQPDPLIGTCLAQRYTIISLLGHGGMGVVYKAQHRMMDRPIAIKMMHTHLMTQANAIKSFYEEAKTIAQLKHHNIITLYDFGISPSNRPYLVMDYLEGPSLRRVIEENGPISLEYLKSILEPIVDGLAYAHKKGIVHKDIKPENIMFNSNDERNNKLLLVDFGLAALSKEQENTAEHGIRDVTGSPAYMSPEQCTPKIKVDHRSDIYSLAVVLYESLSGKLPFDARSVITMLDNHLNRQPTPFNLRNSNLRPCTEIARVFNQALAKDPENRFQTVTAFGQQLYKAIEHDSKNLKIKEHAFATSNVSSTKIPNEGFRPINPDVQEVKSDLDFLPQQAQIEADYIKQEKKSEINVREKISDNPIRAFLDRIKTIYLKSLIQIKEEGGKRCPYCKSVVPLEIQFCPGCERHLGTTSLAIRFVIARKIPGSFTERKKNPENIHNLRNYNTTLARINRILVYVITVILLLTVLVFISNSFNTNKSLKNASEPLHFSRQTVPITKHRPTKKH